MIFDCTTFYNGNLLFQTRFEILKDYVDYFVVCEASRDHTGNTKKLNFDQEFYNKNKDRIIYIKVLDLPIVKLKGKKDYKILSLQMERLFEGIKFAKDDDLIILSDEDEIPNPQNIFEFKSQKYKYGIFMQNMYYYKINLMDTQNGNGNWPGSRICKKKNLNSFFKLRLLKIKNLQYPFWRFDKEKSIQLINNGGWHFSYLMSPSEILNKIKSMAHTEFNKVKFANIENIESNIKNGLDLFDRKIPFKKVLIDETYPKYIRDNVQLYKDWILN